MSFCDVSSVVSSFPGFLAINQHQQRQQQQQQPHQTINTKNINTHTLQPVAVGYGCEYIIQILKGSHAAETIIPVSRSDEEVHLVSNDNVRRRLGQVEEQVSGPVHATDEPERFLHGAYAPLLPFPGGLLPARETGGTSSRYFLG